MRRTEYRHFRLLLVRRLSACSSSDLAISIATYRLLFTGMFEDLTLIS